MEQRGVTGVDIRGMLQRARSYGQSVVPGRYRVEANHQRRPWIVIVEPDPDERRLVIVTVFEVSP